MQPTNIEILNQYIDPDGATPSYYRMLVDKRHIKYITIDAGIYEVDDLCFPPVLLEMLPPFPAGDWNCGRISLTAVGSPKTAFFAETKREKLPEMGPLWKGKVVYPYLDFEMGERLKSNVVAKYARFGWEVGYYVAETQAYSWIEGHDIGPEFLGYLTEDDGRVMGFLIEHVEGRHAGIEDLDACEAVVRRLHGLGIVHGDLNRYNFLISEEGGAVLIDFETAKRSGDTEAMEGEVKGLREKLLDESGNGGVVSDGYESDD
ncbi:hypothetical protein V494_08038 [Pseudogymnoascus sp. VKM F-4513 (FW-928)]|nr:hypothetical protein V494_08038 [Pseudogymnoascus sp. VKM F-4513 (FW-928)]